jgi:hypothetical protein
MHAGRLQAAPPHTNKPTAAENLLPSKVPNARTSSSQPTVCAPHSAPQVNAIGGFAPMGAATVSSVSPAPHSGAQLLSSLAFDLMPLPYPIPVSTPHTTRSYHASAAAISADAQGRAQAAHPLLQRGVELLPESRGLDSVTDVLRQETAASLAESQGLTAGTHALLQRPTAMPVESQSLAPATDALHEGATATPAESHGPATAAHALHQLPMAIPAEPQCLAPVAHALHQGAVATPAESQVLALVADALHQVPMATLPESHGLGQVAHALHEGPPATPTQELQSLHQGANVAYMQASDAEDIQTLPYACTQQDGKQS